MSPIFSLLLLYTFKPLTLLACHWPDCICVIHFDELAAELLGALFCASAAAETKVRPIMAMARRFDSIGVSCVVPRLQFVYCGPILRHPAELLSGSQL